MWKEQFCAVTDLLSTDLLRTFVSLHPLAFKTFLAHLAQVGFHEAHTHC